MEGEIEVAPAQLPNVTPSPQHILISGASGLIGRALVPHLETYGYRVTRLVRREPRSGTEIRWVPPGGRVEWNGNEAFDAVIHLAGVNLSSGRWTRKRRTAIRESRVEGTRALVTALGRLPRPPASLITAGAVGYYGNRGSECLDESAAPGRGFLAEVCRDWEAEACRAEDLGMRVVRLRQGVVLSPDGGALAKMLPFFRAGLGGRLGDGMQWLSWIGLEDLVRVYGAVLADARWSGAINAATPEPVTNAQFTADLARTLHRPALLPVPRFVLRLSFGAMAEETVLASTRAVPKALTEGGFVFRQPTLEPALRRLLSPEPKTASR